MASGWTTIGPAELRLLIEAYDRREVINHDVAGNARISVSHQGLRIQFRDDPASPWPLADITDFNRD